jgi:hypothetical protein
MEIKGRNQLTERAQGLAYRNWMVSEDLENSMQKGVRSFLVKGHMRNEIFKSFLSGN